MVWPRVVAAGAVLGVLLTGCNSATKPSPVAAGSPSPIATTPSPPASTIVPTASPARATPHRTRTVQHTVAAPFRSSVSTVTAADLGKSWHSGCPVAPSGLRAVSVTYWGFDHSAHTGTLVVNAAVVSAVTAAFRSIYAARFPIRRMQPIAAYGGDDNASMAADNTSAFNCRYAVADGPKQWSMHAYGEAVDLNTLENPYTLDGRVYPPAGKPYTDRSRVRPGMVVSGSAPVRAFTAVGWGWGGRWSSSPDYQHFSSNGK